jgi:coenzyme PQQ precursor peptide PqqA
MNEQWSKPSFEEITLGCECTAYAGTSPAPAPEALLFVDRSSSPPEGESPAGGDNAIR